MTLVCMMTPLYFSVNSIIQCIKNTAWTTNKTKLPCKARFKEMEAIRREVSFVRTTSSQM